VHLCRKFLTYSGGPDFVLRSSDFAFVRVVVDPDTMNEADATDGKLVHFEVGAGISNCYFQVPNLGEQIQIPGMTIPVSETAGAILALPRGEAVELGLAALAITRVMIWYGLR
jgi:hypothetical protein